MNNTIQPYFVFSTYHYDKKIIRNHGIAHFYHYYPNCKELDNISAIPDGCIDILFEKGSNGIEGKVCGSVLKRTELNTTRSKEYFGIRFVPGVMPNNLGVSMKELINSEILLEDVVYEKDIVKIIQEAKSWEQCVSIFTKNMIEHNEKTIKSSISKINLCMYIRKEIFNTAGNIKIEELEKNTGYSTRYIGNIFKEYMGMSPKVFCGIVQLQQSVQLINNHGLNKLTEVGTNSGYFDQAHFIREFKKYMGITPLAYKKLVERHNYMNRLYIK